MKLCKNRLILSFFRELMDVVRSLKDQLHVLKDQNRNLKGKMEELTTTGKTGPTSDGVEGKLDILISVLKKTEKLNIEKLSGGRL